MLILDKEAMPLWTPVNKDSCMCLDSRLGMLSIVMSYDLIENTKEEINNVFKQFCRKYQNAMNFWLLAILMQSGESQQRPRENFGKG